MVGTIEEFLADAGRRICRFEPSEALAAAEGGALIIPDASQLILLCDHGFSSSLAAASAVDLGFAGAGDVIGGFEAWRAAGLPTAQPSRRTEDDPLPGMGPRD